MDGLDRRGRGFDLACQCTTDGKQAVSRSFRGLCDGPAPKLDSPDDLSRHGTLTAWQKFTVTVEMGSAYARAVMFAA